MSSRSTESQRNCTVQATTNCACNKGEPDAGYGAESFPSSAMLRAIMPSTPGEQNEAAREVVAHCAGCGRVRGTEAQARATRSLHEILEAETRRIAHSLHDEAGQLLTVVHLKLADISREIPDECQPCLEEVCELLNRVEMQLRQISHELHPSVLEHEGLTPALERLIDGVSRRTGISIALESSVQERFPAPVETAIYRMVQEALTNVGRHSGATGVRLVLNLDGGFVLCAVRDNGIGFDCAAPPAGGLGLAGIRDRVEALGGMLAIAARPGCGAEVSVRIPVPR